MYSHCVLPHWTSSGVRVTLSAGQRDPNMRQPTRTRLACPLHIVRRANCRQLAITIAHDHHRPPPVPPSTTKCMFLHSCVRVGCMYFGVRAVRLWHHCISIPLGACSTEPNGWHICRVQQPVVFLLVSIRSRILLFKMLTTVERCWILFVLHWRRKIIRYMKWRHSNRSVYVDDKQIFS